MCSTKAQYTLSHTVTCHMEMKSQHLFPRQWTKPWLFMVRPMTKRNRTSGWSGVRIGFDWMIGPQNPRNFLSSRILGEVWKGLKFWRAKPLLKWLDIYPLNADSHQWSLKKSDFLQSIIKATKSPLIHRNPPRINLPMAGQMKETKNKKIIMMVVAARGGTSIDFHWSTTCHRSPGMCGCHGQPLFSTSAAESAAAMPGRCLGPLEFGGLEACRLGRNGWSEQLHFT